MTDLVDAASNIQEFTRGSLKKRVRELESAFCSPETGIASCEILSSQLGIELSLLDSALLIKRLAGQIHEVVHTVGILLLLPHILIEGEVIESLSLAAGNTGANFDLETSHRIAEFKFIDWKGGAEAARHRSLFKDFYKLAEADTHKGRYLYVNGTTHPLKFLQSKRQLRTVLGRQSTSLRDHFQAHYNDKFTYVSEYYRYRAERVQIADITVLIPNFHSLID